MTVRSFVRLAVLALLLVATPSIAHAQYTVKEGDTLWRLSGDYLKDPFKWGEVVGKNPFLKEPGRQFQLPDGRLVLLIRPGEKLEGLQDLGIKVEPVSIDQLKPAEQVKVDPIKPVVVASTAWYQSPWFWLLLAVLVGLGAFYAIRRRMPQYESETAEQLRTREREAAESTVTRERMTAASTAAREQEMTQDPITSGTPYVPGGIAPTETTRLENFFNQQAAGRYAERNPGLDRNTVQVIRVGPIEEGTISGEGLVGYLGEEMRPRRITQPIRAYQARYRFPDGTEELLQCLQGCMNPVIYGGDVYRGFTFTPGQVAVPELPTVATEPASVSTPEAVLVPATGVPAVVEQHASVEDGVVKLEIRRATDGQPAMIRMSGVDQHGDNTCELRDGSIVLRFTPRTA